MVNNGGGGDGSFGTNSNSNSALGNDLASGNAGANAGGGAFFGGLPPQYPNYPRFRRAAQDALVYPTEDEPEKNDKHVEPKNVKESKPTGVGAKPDKSKPEAEGSDKGKPEGVDSRFGFFGGGGGGGPVREAIRGAIGSLIRGNDRGYGSYSNGPSYGDRPSYNQQYPINQYPENHHNHNPDHYHNQYPEHNHHGRPDYYQPGRNFVSKTGLIPFLIQYQFLISTGHHNNHHHQQHYPQEGGHHHPEQHYQQEHGYRPEQQYQQEGGHHRPEQHYQQENGYRPDPHYQQGGQNIHYPGGNHNTVRCKYDFSSLIDKTLCRTKLFCLLKTAIIIILY